MAGRFSGRVPTLTWRSWEVVRAELEWFLRKLNDGNNASQETPATPTTVQAGVAADPGDSLAPALSNHTHPVDTAAPANQVALGGASAEGVGAALMRSDATLVLSAGGATDGQTLIYNAGAAAWQPGDAGGGGDDVLTWLDL